MTNPFLLQDNQAYLAWKTEKLALYPVDIKDLLVPINNPYQLTIQEKKHILSSCRKINMAFYQVSSNVSIEKNALLAFCQQFGLTQIDRTLCCEEDDGITALQVENQGQAHDYIPYTNKAINWHTDGYYNADNQQVRSVLLHCERQALEGGDNMLLDHEIVYIKLRDQNPNYIAALMENDVMTIPANVQEGVELRPAQTGPVFFINPNGTLQMRYTARKRNIIWKQSTLVQEAISYLNQLCTVNSPHVLHHRLMPGQGVICNNVLHNRSGFTDSDNPAHHRLLYRIRCYDRID